MTRILNKLDRPGLSEAEQLAEVAKANQNYVDEVLAALSEDELKALAFDWRWWGRPAQQLPPGAWFVWLLMSGRGFGKTRTGAESVRTWKDEVPLIALCAETAGDARDVMVEGESGILATSPSWDYPNYEPSKRRLTWPNGCIATTFGLGEEPDQIRGPQFYKAWADEIAKWKYPDDAWENLELAVRLGETPQIIATTTPKPIKLVRTLVTDPETVVTQGTTWDNIAHLSPVFIRRVVRRHQGTRLGRQELEAELLEDVPGALWTRQMIDYRAAPELALIVVGVDPAATSSEGANETGIVVAGRGYDNRGYVLDDYSGRMSPLDWGMRAVNAYLDHEADRITYETNQGGEMVAAVIKMAAQNLNVSTPPLKGVHASRGKRTRAEPVSALYEQGRISHVEPQETLEDQMVTWLPEDASPDRMDALVWALTDAMVEAPDQIDEDELEAWQASQMHEG